MRHITVDLSTYFHGRTKTYRSLLDSVLPNPVAEARRRVVVRNISIDSVLMHCDRARVGESKTSPYVLKALKKDANAGRLK